MGFELFNECLYSNPNLSIGYMVAYKMEQRES